MLRRWARCHRRARGGLPKCAEGGHLLQPDGAPPLSHLQPLPPQPAWASWGPLPDGLRAPSAHRRNASPPPPPPLRTPGDQPLSPEARLGSGPLPSLWLLHGAQWPAPHGGPTLDSTQATGTDKNKNRIRAINGGEQDARLCCGGDGFVHHCFVTAPLLRGTGVSLIWCVSA